MSTINYDEIVEDKNQLLKYFTSSYKKEDNLRIGTEYEKFIIHNDLSTIKYEGKEGIRSLFKGLQDGFGYTPDNEGSNVIGLFRNGESVSLEPGGQVELSGKPFLNLHDAFAEMNTHLSELKEVTREWDVKWYSCGMNPFLANEDIEWMPKKRYKIMKEYLITQGHLSHKMMKQTCTIQANIDYKSEEDAIKKLRIATGVNSIVTGIFANSPIYKGEETGFMTERSYIWKYTDPERCGIIKNLFSENYSFEDYMEFAMNVHMFLIKRDDQMIDMTSMTFKEYMEKGFNGHKANFFDWSYHLSTVFPEVRLLKYIELRGADSQTPDLALAISALWKGILYNDQALDAAWELVSKLSYDERVIWHEAIAREGLQAKVGKYKTKDLAKELFDISVEGLKKQNLRNSKNQDESIYLEELNEKVIKKGKSPAETLIEKWNTTYNKSLDKLLNHYII